MVHSFNPRPLEELAGRCLQIQDQPGLQREFQDSWGNIKKPCLTKPKTKTKNPKTTKQKTQLLD